MFSNNQKKHINSLKQKKFRTQYGLFVVEGVKMVSEVIQSDYIIENIFATASWKENNVTIDCIEVSEKELNSISYLKAPNQVLAVVKQKKNQIKNSSTQLSIALDNIQDPGNLGTIIRTADWFDIQQIICSKNTVDVYNAKVIQATMGSFFRVNVVYTDLYDFFSTNKELTVYGAAMDGKNIFKEKLNDKLNDKSTILLMGNESKGIADELIPFVTKKITIPKFGEAESLNVASATAILCSEFKRNE